MNLFCFTLEGSTESIYEPAYSKTLKEVLPKYQCSPALLRRKPEWGGSDPNINSSTIKATKKNNRRSCVPMSAPDNNTLEMCRASCRSGIVTRHDSVKELSSEGTHAAAEAGESSADAAESVRATGRLKKLQNLMQAPRGHHSGAGKEKSTSEDDDHLTNVLSNSNPVLTCIGLGKRTEKTSRAAPSPPQQQRAGEDSEEDGVWSPRLGNYLWSPFECPQPWTPFYHTCQQPRHELWVCGGTLSLPRTTEWDRFESLIQELDGKGSDLSPPQTLHGAIPDVQLPQNTLTRFGRFDAFRQHSPLMKAQDKGSSVDAEAARLRMRRETEMSSQRDRKHIIGSSPENTLTAVTSGNMQKDEADQGRVAVKGPFTKGHKQSTNSLESLYSLNSGRSSSSGVTSGSDCSSNRGSLRLDDDLFYSRQFCGRARVHTDYVPSPYDTESLKLTVGDVIDIIAKPPMGIWTGMLNGRMGNFKFIYVDVLTEDSPELQAHRDRQKSTVQEVLRRLSLEEYSLSLQLKGYQTVDDLIRLREHHLTELNVTDPEHRHCLLAAVASLQQLRSDSQMENQANQEAETPGESRKADMSNCPRDSGCHMPSDGPDSSAEDTDLHFVSQYPVPAERTAA